jgi:hypothetical protein
MAFVNVIAIGVGAGGSEPSESFLIAYTVNVNGVLESSGNFDAYQPLTQFNIQVE